VEDPGDPAAAEFLVVLVEEHWALITAGVVEVALGELGGEQRRRVGVDRDVPGLAALAGQRDDRGILETDVADCQVGELLDAGGGVVEGGQQRRVTPALTGGAVRQGEQQPGLLDGQVRDRRLVVLARRDREDVLAARHPRRVLGLQPAVERADRGQALVARRGTVVPLSA
jgi:hypothetical protein